MATICQRCAFRLQHQTPPLARAFSLTSTSQAPKTLPTFEESQNPELNTLLSTLRTTHFVPAYLPKPQRHMVHSPKFASTLNENPRSIDLYNETIPLHHLGPTPHPLSTDLLKRALSLILSSSNSSDFNNIVPLFTASFSALKKSLPSPRVMEQLARKAIQAGKIDVLVQLLRRAKQTGVTLKDEGLLRNLLVGIRETAVGEEGEWTEEGLLAAVGYARSVMGMLDEPAHGSGKVVLEGDVRTRPEVMAVFLEISAVLAREKGQKEVGVVRTYAERVVGAMHGKEVKVELREQGMQWSMLEAIPIWHGLKLALGMVGAEMKGRDQAERIVVELEAALAMCAQRLQAGNAEPGTFNHRALKAWESCSRS